MQKTRFKNGLTLLSDTLPGFQSLSIGVWVKVGTRHETSKEAGISHFLEHMVFKGTKTKSALEIAQMVDRIGGEFNAFTSREHTCFHLLILKRDWQIGLEILIDVLLNSVFDAVELERERKVILQEIAMIQDSPEELVHDFFFEEAFQGHPLSQPILGSKKSIAKLKRSQITSFFHKRYVPSETIVSVVGDIPHLAFKKRLFELTRKEWPGRTRVAKPLRTSPPRMLEGFWWMPRQTEQVHLLWGVPGLSYGSEDRFSAFLLNVYLGGGMSSALFQEIREKKGLAYTVYSSLSPFVDGGVFSVYVATRTSQVALCIQLIEESVERLKKSPLGDEELKTLKENLKGTILIASDHPESRMSSLAKNEIFLGRDYSVKQVCELIDAVSSQDIQRVAQSLLSRERSIFALGPKPSPTIQKRISRKIRYLP